MEADFAIELGHEDAVLELPWTGPDGGPRYYDLRTHPELLGQVEETARVPELGEFLARVNGAGGRLESAKCDAWASSEMNAEDEVFGAAQKFGSYCDLVLREHEERFSFALHEALVKRVTALLKRAPEIPALAEFLLRRCFYHDGPSTREGFYVTFYLFGYGGSEESARKQWGIALRLVENALAQATA